MDNSTLRSAVDDVDAILQSEACNLALNASAVMQDCNAAIEYFLTNIRDRANLEDEGAPITMWTVPDSWNALDREIVQGLELNMNVVCPVPDLGPEATLNAIVQVLGAAYYLRQPFITYAGKPHFAFADNSPIRLRRVQLPEYQSHCNETGVYRCGYRGKPVIKLASSKLSSKNSVAFDYVKQFSYTGDDQSNILGRVYFAGLTLEEASCEWVQANFATLEPYLPDPSRLVTPSEVDSGLRVAFLVIAALELALFVAMALGVVHYRRVRAILSASPKFLLLMLLGAAWSMFWILFSHQETIVTGFCVARVWARHLGFVIIFGALALKTFRIASVFNLKSSKAPHLTDRVLLFRFLLIVAYGCVNLVAWTVSSPPKASTLISNNQSYQVCEVTWWDTAMYLQELVAMIGLALLCYRVRKAPSAFNESKYIGLAVYNWIVVGVILQIILNSTTGSADFYFVIQSLEVLVTVLTAIAILFAPKFYLIFRGKGNDGSTSTYRGSNQGGSHPKTSANAGGNGSGSNHKSGGEMEMSSGHEEEDSSRVDKFIGKQAVQEVKALRHENARLIKEMESMRTQLLRLHNPHSDSLE
ncbi:hypothetical protein CAOG_04403 [Capsaspora owczarzaki ATCC 30864]|nr:hypothetical protein CAOG_04403 [Capsaspora owczarzaki ATCC 30864]|eukprot:XP_004348231.1 hypothetical protein CAOG_04403 [Capsaspora owczarzaki ATCC 30864]